MALELVNGGDQKSFEVHVRKSPDCTEGTVGKNTDVKGNSGEDSERKQESYRESFYNIRYTYIIMNIILVEI